MDNAEMTPVWNEVADGLNDREIYNQEPKSQRQLSEYIQDVGYTLFVKFKQELQEETVKQYEFSMHGEHGPDISPPSGFVLFVRSKLMCNRYIETHLCNSNDQVCRDWVAMSSYEKKPWEDCSRQLQENWPSI